jgi:AcrR family transcriptional regulator
MVAVVTVEQQPADAQPAVGMRRPGGRTARVRSAVHTAVADLVTEQPWGDLNIPMIAQRSGVHQATIYRRWGTISGLLNDVVAEQLARMAPIPDTGSLRGDLERYAAEAAGHVAGPLGALVLRTAMSELETGPRAADDPAVAARRRRFQPMLDTRPASPTSRSCCWPPSTSTPCSPRRSSHETRGGWSTASSPCPIADSRTDPTTPGNAAHASCGATTSTALYRPGHQL